MAFDSDSIKTLLRLGLIFIAAACALVTRWVVKLIQNPRLLNMAQKLFLTFLGFVVLRALAAYFDSYFDFEIGWFSASVTYAFNVWILWLIYRLYRKFKEEEYEIHKTGEAPVRNPDWINRRRVSSLADELLDELKINIRKTDHLEKDMTAHLSDG